MTPGNCISADKIDTIFHEFIYPFDSVLNREEKVTPSRSMMAVEAITFTSSCDLK